MKPLARVVDGGERLVVLSGHERFFSDDIRSTLLVIELEELLKLKGFQ